MTPPGQGGPVDGRRRQLLYAGVAGAAALAGAALAWRRHREDEAGQDAAGLWSMNFSTPAGASLAMRSFRGQPLLLNFWATWCPPCVEELPLLDGFYREVSVIGWKVLGIAVDQAAAVRTFLARTPVSFPIAVAGFGGTELSKALGNSGGGLPFSVLIGASGKVLQRRMGTVTSGDLAAWRLALP
jgi:thiol-disulfide isomerase/thioredoxin